MRLGAALATFRTLGAHVVLHRPASVLEAETRMAELAGTVDRIVVVGGDGMVHLAANALVDSPTVLGIIAAGTGNDVATSLGLPTELEDACKTAMRPGVAIDLIERPDRVAVTVATAGFSVAVNDRANEMQWFKGAAKYALSSVLELRGLERHALTLTLDSVAHDIEANVVAVANMPYFGGGMRVAPDARFDDGHLDVVVIGPAPRSAFAALLPLVFSGRHVRSRYVAVHRAQTVELSGPDLALRADGEDFGRLPVALRVRPAALRIAGARLPTSA